MTAYTKHGKSSSAKKYSGPKTKSEWKGLCGIVQITHKYCEKKYCLFTGVYVILSNP